MQTSLELAIRDQLARYLAGEITLRAFEDWFVPASWGKIGKGDARLDALIGEIELRLAERTSGHRTTSELRALLVPLVTRYVVGAADVRIGSEVTLTTRDFVAVAPAGVRPIPVAGSV